MFRLKSFSSQFDTEGEKFRQNFLVALAMAAAASMLAVVAASGLGVISPLPSEQLGANLISILIGLIVALSAWAFPKLWHLLAWIETANCTITILVALYTMPDDGLRYVWFFVQAGGIFLLLGSVAGWASTVLTIAIVAVSKGLDLIVLPDIAFVTFCIGLIGISAVLHAHHNQAVRYRERLKLARDAAEFAAEHDPLTGLLNRSAFTLISARIWQDRRLDTFPVALIFLDVDHFKKVNDVHGHHAGDQVLQTVSQTVSESTRRTDVVARMGGEEIVVLLPSTNSEDAYLLAERIRQTIEGCSPIVRGVPLNVTASVGWAIAQTPTVPVDDLLRAADEAMYLAKSRGRNRVWPLGTPSRTHPV